MIYDVTVGERVVRVDVKREKGGWVVQVGDGPVQHVRGGLVGPTDWVLHLADGVTHAVGLHLEKERFDAQVDGHAFRGTVIDPRRKALDLTGGAAQGEVRTMMPGAVVRVPVIEGQAVHKGQVLVVVEAMKMENEFKSPIDGVVTALHVKPGQAIDSRALLVTVTP